MDDDCHLTKSTTSKHIRRRKGGGSLSQLGSLKALIRKDCLSARRHLGFLAFQTVLPILVLILFYCSIGRPLENLQMIVINQENCTNHVSSKGSECSLFEGSQLDMFSCLLLNNVKNSLEIVIGQDVKWAQRQVELGISHAWLQIPADFSTSLKQRLLLIENTNEGFNYF